MILFSILFSQFVIYSLMLKLCFGQDIAVNSMDSSESDNFKSVQNNSVHFIEKGDRDCTRRYSPGCIQKSIKKLLETLEQNSVFQLAPGVQLVWTPQSKFRSSLSVLKSGYQMLSLGRISKYLNSISIKIQLLQPRMMSFLNSIQRKVFNVEKTSEARKKMKDGAGLIGMAMMFGGSVLLVAMTALGVLAGKAVMTGALAFLLAAATGLASLRGDDKPDKILAEVISRPVVTHGHTHSSEVQYEQHSGHGHHYVKRRNVYAPIFDTDMDNKFTGYKRPYK